MGRPARHRDVVIRGQRFASIPEAAAFHGVRYQAVWRALKDGNPDRVGTGSRGQVPMRVSICGVEFENARAAASHFGVCYKSVLDAIREGDPDRIGRPRRVPSRAKPIALYGFTWPSRSAACRALGLSDGFLWWFERHGRAASRERMLATVMAWSIRREAVSVKRNGRAAAFALAGHEWPTQAAAARDLGMRPKTLNAILHHGTERERARLEARAAAWVLERQATGGGSTRPGNEATEERARAWGKRAA